MGIFSDSWDFVCDNPIKCAVGAIVTIAAAPITVIAAPAIV